MPFYKDTDSRIHFLDDAEFADILPSGSVRITNAEARKAQAAANAPTSEALAAAERIWRDRDISATDSLVARHRDELEAERPTTLTVAQYKQLQGYRQDLRDWPEAEHFPALEYRPEQPAWLADQIQ